MNTLKVTFENAQQEILSAFMELPADRKAHNYVLFAHCFTCNKNLVAVKNISRSLTNEGFGVLRFDFTGLGESEGEFSDTNFSSNIEDLISACKYLESEWNAPTVLIGHSLGGAAVIHASAIIDTVKAVATIGAPSSPQHVQHLFQSSIDEIESSGKAKVNIGGRSFSIKKQFVDDLNKQDMASLLKNLRKKSILIMHSPQDNVVGIENASENYHAAHHPKSFISLDGADHLLSNKNDSLYVGSVIATWAKRYVEIEEKRMLKTNSQVVVQLSNEDEYTTQIQAGKHTLIADEPEDVGGNGFGPTPYELLSASLGACTAMTVKMYAAYKKIPLENITVHIDHGKEYLGDSENTEEASSKIDHFERKIALEGNLSQDQREKLLEIANKCPVHRTLKSDVEINSKLMEN